MSNHASQVNRCFLPTSKRENTLQSASMLALRQILWYHTQEIHRMCHILVYGNPHARKDSVMEKKMTARDIKSQETKTKITEAARKLMRQYGYENTAIQDVCREAGVSTGTVYHFFPSKHAILEEIFASISPFHKPYDLNFAQDSPYLMIDHIVREFSSMCSALGPEVVYNSAYSCPSGNKTFYDRSRPNTVFTMQAIAGFQEAGKIRKDISVEQIAYFIMNQSMGCFYQCYTMDEMDKLAQNIKTCMTVFFDGLVL